MKENVREMEMLACKGQVVVLPVSRCFVFDLGLKVGFHLIGWLKLKFSVDPQPCRVRNDNTSNK
jgi:hypothetical protein